MSHQVLMTLPEDSETVIQRKVSYVVHDPDSFFDYGNGAIAVKCGTRSYQKEIEVKTGGWLRPKKTTKVTIPVTETVWYHLPYAINFHKPEGTDFLGLSFDPDNDVIRLWYSKKKAI